MSLNYPGADELIKTIDAAVALGDPQAITNTLQASLSHLIAEQRVQLPAVIYTANPARYERRLLHLSERYGYSVIAMTWAPGQGTLIHDHAGLWCVEGVWEGALDVIPYDLVESKGDELRFEPQPVMHAARGSCGSLIPPFDYHTIRNSSATEIAISVHIYGGPMNHCGTFEPIQGQWHRRQERMLETAGI